MIAMFCSGNPFSVLCAMLLGKRLVLLAYSIVAPIVSGQGAVPARAAF